MLEKDYIFTNANLINVVIFLVVKNEKVKDNAKYILLKKRKHEIKYGI